MFPCPITEQIPHIHSAAAGRTRTPQCAVRSANDCTDPVASHVMSRRLSTGVIVLFRSEMVVSEEEGDRIGVVYRDFAGVVPGGGRHNGRVHHSAR
jgi:hypothetical protein